MSEDVAVKVRDLAGHVQQILAPISSNGQALAEAVGRSLNGKFRLFHKGAEISADQEFVLQFFGPDDFLVVLPVGKSRKKKVSSHNAQTQATQPSQESQPHRRSQPVSTAQKPADAYMDPCSPSRADNPASTSPSGQTSPFALMQSPPKNDAGMFSLLPGYLSRPNPSPERAQKRQRLTQEGGFTTHQTLASSSQLTANNVASLQSQRSNEGAKAADRGEKVGLLKEHLDRREPSLNPQQSGRTSVTSSLPSRGFSLDGQVSEALKQGQLQGDRGFKRGAETNEEARRLGASKHQAEDVKVQQKKEAGDALWAELANELHASEQRRQPKSPTAHIEMPHVPIHDVRSPLTAPGKVQIEDGAVEGQSPKSGALSRKERERLERMQLKARNALLAHAEKDSVLRDHNPGRSPAKAAKVISSPLPGKSLLQESTTAQEEEAVDVPAENSKSIKKKKSKQRIFLPGGHDIRLTSQEKLSSKEAAVVGKLPLPDSLQRLEKVFHAVNTVHSFLQKQDIQASWFVMRDAVRNFPGAEDVELEDIEKMVKLCPDVVFLQDTLREDGPRSIVEFNQKLEALETAMQQHSPHRSPRGGPSFPTDGIHSPLQSPQVKQEEGNDPLSIHSDAAEIIRQRTKQSLILEILDVTRHSVGMIARAMSSWKEALQGVSSDVLESSIVQAEKDPAQKSAKRSAKTKTVGGKKGRRGRQDVSGDDKTSAAAGNEEADGDAGIHTIPESSKAEAEAGEEAARQESSAEESAEEVLPPQAEKGRKAAIARRQGAFRRGLVRAVTLLHDKYLAGRIAKSKSLSERSIPTSAAAQEAKAAPQLGWQAASMQPPQAEPHDPSAAEPVHSDTRTSDLEAGKDLELKTRAGKSRQSKTRNAGKRTVDVNAEEDGSSVDSLEGFDPIKAGHWHRDFPIGEVTMTELISASIKAATDYEQAQQSGRLKHFREDFVGSTNAPRPPRMTRKTEPCRDCTQLGVLDFLEHLKELPWYNAQVVHIEDMPARLGVFKQTAMELSKPTWKALSARGISQLFSHQAEAIESALSGRHVVVSTSTASGKSLCYNIPVIEALAEDRGSTAIYIFPTKALAQDQMRALRAFLGAAFPDETPIADVYDGDTPKEERGEIRDRAQMIITNPDMLHQSILPLHGQFATLLSKLKYVIVDEGHAYRGAFGCHTALVIRRLRRICNRVYNTFPTFVVTSATIANPKELVKSLLGVDEVTLIDQDGSPHGPQRYVLWNPPLTHFNAALRVANQNAEGEGGQISRTEHRARKGERKRKTRQAVIKAVEDGAYGGGLEDADNVNHTLALSVARMHRLRKSAYSPVVTVESEDEGSLDLGLDTVDPEQAVVQGIDTNGEKPHFKPPPLHFSKRLQEKYFGQSGSKAAEDPSEFDPSAEGGPIEGVNVARESAEAKSESQPDGLAADESEKPATQIDGNNIAPEQSTAQDPVKAAAPKRRRRGRVQLSKEAIQAAMTCPVKTEKEEAKPAPVEDLRKQAIAAVAGITVAREKIKFEPKNIAYRSDEAATNDGQNRLVLRRRLHGERFGQKSGMKHPMGQYAHATEEINQRMPGQEWQKQPSKGKYGTAGVSLDKRRKSPIVEISTLLVECVQHGLRTIAFCKTRKLCELVITYTREMLRQSAPHLSHAISVYRAGYNPTERREIEKALFNGDILAVAATNALELGLDVGSLDLTMHLGFQGSIASFRQQAGRAGRREQQSMSIYVAFDGPLDQYFMTYPRNLFDKPIEGAHIDPENAMLLEQHLVCASAETPLLAAEDHLYFGEKIFKTANTLTMEGYLGRHPMSTPRVQALHYIGRLDNPASQFSLRAIDPERYQIVNDIDGKVIEEIEESKAFFQVYDGAVYMFQGRTYLCKKLDLQTKVAVVRPVDVKYYTSIREHQDIFVLGGNAVYPSPETIVSRLRGDEEPTMAQCAEAEHTTRWLGFHRVRHGTGEIFDSVDLFLPDVQFPTQAAYLRVPPEAKANLAKAGLGEQWREGLHAAMHAMQNVVPLHMMCGPNDLGAECDNPYSARFRPDRLLLYDKCPGGIGLAYKVCDLFGVLMRKAVALIEACPCTSDTGCPGCVQHTGCNQYNAVLHKQAGIVVLNAVLDAQAKFRGKLATQLAGQGADDKSASGILQELCI